MCAEWRDDFDAFLRDMGPCPLGHSLDRIDNEGHYEPKNCRWANTDQQANNKRSSHVLEHQGERHTIAEWERLRGFVPGTLKRRIQSGWPTARALSAPIRQVSRS